MSSQPGADELRMRTILRKQGVGPDADPAAPVPPRPVIPPKPTARPRDWLDELLDGGPPAPKPASEPDDEPRQEPEEEPNEDAGQADQPRAFQPQPDYWPQPHAPAFITEANARPAVSAGTRKLLYNATAAGAGWGLGLYQEFADAIADCGQQSIGGALVLSAVGILLIAHLWDRRTRHWWPGIAWVARIPLATALLAVALWAPAAS